MTTTQERAGVEGDIIRRALISAQRELKELLDWQPCDHSVGVCSCSTRRALEAIEAALRQPQAARLTEEERERLTDFGQALADNASGTWSPDEVRWMLSLLRRLTAAPAQQVTREEIALPSCTLVECPVGLFMYGETLGFKSEYGDNNGRLDAYVVSTGEFFWGAAPQTIESQRAQIVTPIDYDAIMSLLAERGLVKEG